MIVKGVDTVCENTNERIHLCLAPHQSHAGMRAAASWSAMAQATAKSIRGLEPLLTKRAEHVTSADTGPPGTN